MGVTPIDELNFTNLTNLNGTSDLVNVISFIQFDAGLPLIQLMILVLTTISFMTMKTAGFETTDVLGATMFLGSLLSLFAWLLGYIPQFWFTTFTILTILSVIVIYTSKQ